MTRDGNPYNLSKTKGFKKAYPNSIIGWSRKKQSEFFNLPATKYSILNFGGITFIIDVPAS